MLMERKHILSILCTRTVTGQACSAQIPVYFALLTSPRGAYIASSESQVGREMKFSNKDEEAKAEGKEANFIINCHSLIL